MNKKKLYALMTLVIILAILGTGTLAYLTTRAVTHNVITTGDIKVKLVETQDLDKDPDTPETDYPKETVTGLMPGKEHSKIVRIKNVGDNPAWVRIQMTVVAKNPEGKSLDAGMLDLNYHTEPDDKWMIKDGIYYYKDVLNPGESTTPLFDTVFFKETMENEYQNAQIDIGVKAEGIQYKNNTNFDTAWPADVEILENIF